MNETWKEGRKEENKKARVTEQEIKGNRGRKEREGNWEGQDGGEISVGRLLRTGK